MLTLLRAMNQDVELPVGMCSLCEEERSAGSLRGSPRSRSLQQMLSMWGYSSWKGGYVAASDAWGT